MTEEAKSILAKIPELLRQSPEFRGDLYRMLSEEFPRRGEMAAILEEIRELRRDFQISRKETLERFEAMDRRFEEEIRELRSDFQASRKETLERFEKIDRRFEEMDRRFHEVLQEMRDTRKWVEGNVGGFLGRAGKNLEGAIAGTLRIALGMKDLDPSTIRLRQKIEDEEGIIGPAGRRYEYDIFVTNGRTCVFEVKSVADEEDVDRFADKCDLVERVLGAGRVERVLVTLAKTPEIARRCETRGVLLA
ncbi:MAG: hypothetical protein HY720_07540 [Planctomycetes bacterium]|nr:hypothetical protein [Planctomycetota bacterium]